MFTSYKTMLKYATKNNRLIEQLTTVTTYMTMMPWMLDPWA